MDVGADAPQASPENGRLTDEGPSTGDQLGDGSGKTVRADGSRRAASAVDVRHFRVNGWARLREVLSNDETDAIRSAVEWSKEGGRHTAGMSSGTSASVYAHQTSKEYQQTLQSRSDLRIDVPSLRPIVRRLARDAAELLGAAEVRVLWDKTVIKPPWSEGSRPTYWHQDLPAIPVDRRDLLTFWIPLSDISVEDGALRFVPRSHRLGPLGKLGLLGEERRVEDLLTEEDLELVDPVVDNPVELGDISVHDGLMLHGAGPNKGDRPRVAWTIVFVSADALWNGGSFGNARLNELVKGTPPFQPFSHATLDPCFSD